MTIINNNIFLKAKERIKSNFCLNNLGILTVCLKYRNIFYIVFFFLSLICNFKYTVCYLDLASLVTTKNCFYAKNLIFITNLFIYFSLSKVENQKKSFVLRCFKEIQTIYTNVGVLIKKRWSLLKKFFCF